MMKHLFNLVLLLMAFVFFACKDEIKQEPIDLALNFDFVAGNTDLVYTTEVYTNAAGNDFSVDNFWMYISNIQFLDDEEAISFSIENSYHLLAEDADFTNTQIMLKELPWTQFKYIQFSIGVDAPTNTDISAIAGDLDPARAWNWNTGYKFVSLEGDYYPPTGEPRGLVMHIGLDQNYKTLKFELTEQVQAAVKEGRMNFKVDIMRLFNGVNEIDLEVNNTIKAQVLESGQVADNYANGMIQLAD